MPGPSLKLIGSTRVSTEDQADHGSSLAAQAAKIRAYTDAQGHQLVASFEDGGYSAKSLDRPGLQAALAMLDAGEADGLVVAKLDRLTRSVADFAELLESHFGPRSPLRLVSCSETIDTRTASGRMLLFIQMAVFQWERESIVERTADAMDHKRTRGEQLGQVPFGQALDADGCTLVPCPEELQALALMRSLSDCGWTLKAIAAELDARGFRPKRGGAHWSRSSVAEILKRTTPPQDQDLPS